MGRGRLRELVLAAAICGLAAAPTSAAPPATFPDAYPSRGPLLAGTRAVWLTGVSPPPAVSGVALKTGTLDGTAETLISDPDGELGWDPAFHRIDLAASGDRIAVHYPIRDGQRTLLLEPSGTSSIADDCNHASLDLHGDLLAFAALCGASSGGVRDLRTGETQGVSGAVSDIRVAGRYAAWREPVFSQKPELVVYDRYAAEVAYRVDVEKLLPPSDFIYYRFDLAPDGKVAIAYNVGGALARASWFSPSEPWPHALADRVGGEVALAGDMVALKRYPQGRDAEFAVVDLAGRTLQVFDHDDPGYGTAGLDFDGSTLVWHSHRRGIRISSFPVQVDSVTERFDVVPKRFRAGRKARRGKNSLKAAGGTLLRFRLSRPARVSILIERIEGMGDPCERTGPPPPFCARVKRVATLRLGPRRGRVRHRFSGTVRRRKLAAGRYRATIATRRGSAPGVRETVVPFSIVGR